MLGLERNKFIISENYKYKDLNPTIVSEVSYCIIYTKGKGGGYAFILWHIIT